MPPSGPDALGDAARLLQRGDRRALAAALGHGPGYAAVARELSDRLDPRAWLVAMGASWREHDLGACARAMTHGDDAALAVALGFGEQALNADILHAGRSVFARRSGGMDYYEEGPAPLSLLDNTVRFAPAPQWPALEAALWGDAGGRTARLRLGLRRGAVTTLQAAAETVDLPPRARDAARHADARAAAGSAGADLGLPRLEALHWLGLEVRAVSEQGELWTLRLGRDDRGWCLVESSRVTLAQRLESERDRRLEHLRRLALELQRASGAWPADESRLTLRPADLCDPSAPSGRRGWAEFDAAPPRTIALRQPDSDRPRDPAAVCLERGPGGFRAITRDGTLTWLSE
ncbi:MAG: hypothetical protein KJ044_10740 [Planctomycetes bacterium]|nr:hypothetical protein [Planctomycetota bacterium]